MTELESLLASSEDDDESDGKLAPFKTKMLDQLVKLKTCLLGVGRGHKKA